MQRENLEAAVAAGVIDAESAGRLIVFLERQRGEVVETPGDEGVRFARGFHDVFITIGIVLLGLAAAFSVVVIDQPEQALLRTGVALGAALAAWGLAEYLTRRRRLVLPSMALNLAVVVFTVAAVCLALSPADPVAVVRPGSVADTALIAAISAVLVAVAFRWRFGLPFAVAVLALTLIGLAVYLVALAAPRIVLEYHFWVMLVAGLAVFAAAVAYDLADPRRRTTRADTAFWLHLIAAPLVVHAAAALAIGGPAQSAADVAIVFALVLALGFVAVVLDRRAPLVAVLGYFGAALAFVFNTATTDEATAVIATLLALGAFVVLLGVGWRATRRAVLAVVPLPARLRTLSPLPDPAP
ncbi:DUF2339 domain-containing protein [Methylobrevis albus]|uniref:DUF2157 domain-containing protein n=1 Tax=Methylobrevis albus TaxID=2793297 RepID=A0A931MYV6_9HYPH|nr:hypothetical protein [Methylobrevis albus]MBH0238852.1 hypothetical protein [Methylobrevis albus]